MTDFYDQLGLAIDIAFKAHIGQVDKAGEPYILHPLRVMARVEREHHGDLAMMAVAVLHDVIEDSPFTLELLSLLGISNGILKSVDALTRRFDETYMQFVERAANNPMARLVKLLDLEDNMDPNRNPVPHSEETTNRLKRYEKAVFLLRSRS